MAKDLYVYSTLASSVNYVNYDPAPAGGLPAQSGEGVLIQGGTGIADKFFVTPRGVITPITAEQLLYLEQNTVFQLHKKNGFITVEDKKQEVEKVVSAGMQSQDESAQLTPEDFGEGANEPTPSTGKIK